MKNGKVSSYTAASSPLECSRCLKWHFISWQTCSIEHNLNFSRN